MNRLAVLAIGAVGASLAVATGALAGPSASHKAPTTARTAAAIGVRKVGLGRILVDSKGRTLYLFEKDRGKKSSCYGSCAQVWPPAIAPAHLSAGSGAKRGLLGTTKRRDGKTELTYAGHPLYRYVSDTRAGQTTGQGLNQFGAKWYVLAPSGKKIDKD